MTSMLTQPGRCLLDDTQLAAALALGHVTPPADSPLPHVPAPVDPRAALRGSAILEGDGLAPGWAEALAVLAAPDHVVSVAAGVAGAAEWVTSVISCGAQDGPFVAHPGDGRHDLALLPALVDAVLYADELLAVTEGPSGTGDPALALGLPGLVAFAALADALQRARLQALIERRPRSQSEWGNNDLAREIADGAAHEDTRWASTALRHLSPVPLDGAASALVAGLDELEGAGIVERAGDGWSLTAVGRRHAIAFGQLVHLGMISRAAIDAGGAPAAMNAAVVRTVGALWLLTWNIDGDHAAVVLEEVTAGQALEVVWGMLRPTS